MEAYMFLKPMVCALVALAALSSEVGGQTKTTQSRPTYFDVVDEAFRFSDGAPSEFKEIESRTVIRYLPGDDSRESQIVILNGGTDKLRVIRYSLRRGVHSIQVQYNQAFAQSHTVSLDEIVRKLEVERTELKQIQRFSGLAKQLPDLAVSTKLSSDICMDGTIFEIWIQTPSNRIHASLSDCAYGPKTESNPLIRWMKEIRAQAEHL